MNNPLSQDSHFLQQLLNAGVEGILAFDRECRYIAWNDAMECITGMLRGEVLGKQAFELFPFLKDTGEDQCFFAALAGKKSTSNNRPYIVPETNRQGFYQAYYSPLRNDQDEIIGGIAIVHDITERKRAEEAAQEAHQRLTFHVENSPLAVIEWDSEFRVSRWSESAERLFGWQPNEVLGKHVSDWHFVFDEDLDAVVQVTDRQRVGAELQGVLRNRNYTKDGGVLHCEWYNSVLRDENGRLVSVLSLVLDVTARKLAEEERAGLLTRERDLRKQAEEADRLKDEFLATLSHELRTPLTSILGWATLVRNGDVDRSENLDRALEIIERNARSQARLIDDLLDVSRIITGNLQLDVYPLNVAPIIIAAIDALRPAATAKGIQIDTDLDYQSCLVSGDPNRLRQVIWNLLMNSIKFTPRGGKVSFSLKCVGAGARVTITDTGEGISPEFLPYVFHRFRQEEGSISRKAGGLGLGLAVVRHLVELHGGSVSAESPGSGRGATFTVDLPLATDGRDGEVEAARQAKQSAQPGAGAATTTSGTVANRLARLSRDANGDDVQTGQLAGIRVLLVEDDDDSRNLLRLLLERYGAEVLPVASSAEAQSAFLQNIPDVVISDIGMAEEDGYELIRKIRLLPIQQSLLTNAQDNASTSTVVPAIALTGYATLKDRERALSAGYQLHLAKPVEPDELVTSILSLIERRDL